MSKYIFLFLLAILIAFQSVAFSVFADTIDGNLPETLNIEVQSSIVVDNGGVQPMGIKVKIARTVLLGIVSNIRSTAYSVINSRAVSWFTTANIRNTVMTYIYSIANYIESIAFKLDTVTQYSYQILRDLVSQALTKAGGPTQYADQIAKFIEYFFL